MSGIEIKEVESEEVGFWELEELACMIAGIDYDKIDADSEIIENVFTEVFDCSMVSFKKIVSKLLPLIDVGSSPLTEKLYKGFSDSKNEIWLLKMEANKR